jgi:hypothetical protein
VAHVRDHVTHCLIELKDLSFKQDVFIRNHLILLIHFLGRLRKLQLLFVFYQVQHLIDLVFLFPVKKLITFSVEVRFEIERI